SAHSWPSAPPSPARSVRLCWTGTRGFSSVTQEAYALLGLTAIVGGLAAALTFAVLRFAAAARDASRQARPGGETALLSAALEEAVARLKAQERATAAR